MTGTTDDAVGSLTLDANTILGFDVGGTKIDIYLEDRGGRSHSYRVRTHDYPSMHELLVATLSEIARRPTYTVVAIAGVKNPDGSIRGTNIDWPTFNPRFSGRNLRIRVEAVNDLEATAYSIKGITPASILPLNNIEPPQGQYSKLIVGPGTGLGVSALMWERRLGDYVVIPSEGGHSSLHPIEPLEYEFVEFMRAGRHTHWVSAEHATSAGVGFANILRFFESTGRVQQSLISEIRSARSLSKHVLTLARSGEATCRMMAELYGGLLGGFIRDMALAFVARQVYLVGGIMTEANAPYFASQTTMLQRFNHPGAEHAEWLAAVPVSLVLDPLVTVRGAVVLGRELAF